MSEDQTARILEAIGAVRADLLAALRSEIDSLRTEIRSEIEGLRSEFRSEIEGLRLRLDGLEAKLISVRADVMARIDRLQDEMGARRESEVVNLGIAERAARDANTAREHIQTLSSQISALMRMIRMLESRMDQYEGRNGAGRPQ